MSVHKAAGQAKPAQPGERIFLVPEFARIPTNKAFRMRPAEYQPIGRESSKDRTCVFMIHKRPFI